MKPILFSSQHVECELVMPDGRRKKFYGQLSDQPLPTTRHTTRSTFYSMFAEEVSAAVDLVIERWKPALRKVKKSKQVLGFFICEAARRSAVRYTDQRSPRKK